MIVIDVRGGVIQAIYINTFVKNRPQIDPVYVVNRDEDGNIVDSGEIEIEPLDYMSDIIREEVHKLQRRR